MKKLLYSLSIAIILYISSCTKIRTTEIGDELIPSVDNVTVFDTTLEVISEFYSLPDSTRISSSVDHVLGLMEDPTFGKTTGEIYVRMNPQSKGYPFGKSPDSIVGLDSVVLGLRYTGVYGDTNSVQSLKVYEVDQGTAFKDSSLGYLISHPPFAANTLIGEKNNIVFTTLNDSLTYTRGKDTVKTVNEVRVPISNSYGLKLMNLDTAKYRNDTTYRENVTGFAIRMDPSSPVRRALSYYNLVDVGTKLTFHYRRIFNGKLDTVVTDFVFRTRANANLVSRDPTGTPYGNQLVNGTVNQEQLYLQSSPGSYALLKIPGLSGLANGLIYKAVLTTDRLEGTDDKLFKEPSLLFLDAVDSAANKYLTIPNSFPFNQTAAPLYYNPAQFGGFLANGRYEFDLSRYVQGIVTRKEKNYALRLYAPFYTDPFLSTTSSSSLPMTINSPLTRGRVIVAGGANPVKKLRLYIIYSKI